MLALTELINPENSVKPNVVKEKTIEEDPPEQDGWTEIGRHNRKVVTRAVCWKFSEGVCWLLKVIQLKTVHTPISRIFGGQSRSTLRRPGASDSANVESWRHLGLDIQSADVGTVEDALMELSRPEMVEVNSPQQGKMVDGSKQYLIESLPPILVLHIKRFQYDPQVKDVLKQTKHIRFGPELEIPRGKSYLASAKASIDKAV